MGVEVGGIHQPFPGTFPVENAHHGGPDALVPDQPYKAGGVAATSAGEHPVVHGLVPQDALGIGMGLHVVDLGGDDLLRRETLQDRQVQGLIRPDAVP